MQDNVHAYVREIGDCRFSLERVWYARLMSLAMEYDGVRFSGFGDNAKDPGLVLSVVIGSRV